MLTTICEGLVTTEEEIANGRRHVDRAIKGRLAPRGRRESRLYQLSP
jgi:hypothetical protein